MPEGDNVWQAAQQLRAALAGNTLTRCDLRVPRFATVDFTGRTVDSVVSRGKHLLIRVAPDAHDPRMWTIHSHLQMEGTWQVYRRDPHTNRWQKWRRPAFQARAILGTADALAVGFSLGILEVLDHRAEDRVVGGLGPDLLGADWNPDVVLSNLLAQPGRAVGLALLDQRILAGAGNIYRNEVCFLAGIHPATPIADVPDLPSVVRLAKDLLEANREPHARSTTGSHRPGERLWVYGREHQPCRKCGTPIRRGVLGGGGDSDRNIFWCPQCQPAP